MRKVTAVIVAALLLSACGGGGSTPAAPGSASTPPSAEPVADCVEPRQQAESGVALRTGSGLHLDALVLGTGRTGIVFANMSEGDLCQWFLTALIMSKKGYRTAVFNYSGDQFVQDVLLVTEELRRRGVEKVALVGASKGGTASIAAAVGRPDVAALVELSAPDSYEGVDASAEIAKVKVPTWLGVGTADTAFVPSADRLYAASAAPVKHLEKVTSAEHGTGLTTEAVWSQIDAFLAEHAPPG